MATDAQPEIGPTECMKLCESATALRNPQPCDCRCSPLLRLRNRQLRSHLKGPTHGLRSSNRSMPDSLLHAPRRLGLVQIRFHVEPCQPAEGIENPRWLR